MATTRMIQLYVEQLADALVSEVANLNEEVFTFLDPDKTTTVVEITSETIGGVIAKSSTGVPLGVPDNAFTRVRLFFHDAKREEEFFGPSHIPSPGFAGAIGAGLQVAEVGYTPGPQYALARAIGAHAYFEEA
jgi:hypothetical protein